MKIGIYLAYEPHVTLKAEGLGRYLSALLEGFIAEKNEVVIACPEWMVKNLSVLMDDAQIDVDKVRVITVNSPAAIKIVQILRQWKHKPPKQKRPKKFAMLHPIFSMFSRILSIVNVAAFLLITIPLLLIACVIGIPVVLCFALITMPKILIRKRRENPSPKGPLFGKLKHYREVVQTELIQVTKERLLGVAHPFATLSRDIQEKTQIRLIKKINRESVAEIWFTPTLNWPLFQSINGPKVRNAPDLVTSVFATGFSSMSVVAPCEEIRQVIRKEKFFISYSKYIKDTLLVKEFVKNPEDVIAIPHGVNALEKHIDIYKNTARLNYPKDVNMIYAKEVLKNAIIPGAIAKQFNVNVALYLDQIVSSDIRYIFYSSQARATKNIMNLLKAYKYLLRNRYKQVKLILTGDYNVMPSLVKFILDNRLEYDVISIPQVSTSHLSVLYACADLVVNPTLYEGGFPFTFAEGMSVGTPSVMGRIPQVMEVMDGCDADDFLFDPYDWRDMAKKIEFGLDNRDRLLQKQTPIYDKMKQRTWGIVAQDYIKAFDYFIDRYHETPQT